MNGACLLFLAWNGTVEEVAYLQSVLIFLQQFSNGKCHLSNNCISQVEWMPSDGKMHLGLGYVCMSVLTEECLPGKPFSQEETNSSTSKFWLSSAVLSVDLLWLNEERRRGINFLTSGTQGPAGLCCAACGGCNIFDVFCLPATAETACWLVTARGAIAARGCCSP